MNYTKINESGSKTIKNFTLILNKIPLCQLILPSLLSLIYLINNHKDIFTGILISGFTSSFYTQLIRLSSHNKIFTVLGFPIRLLLTAIPCAILVHKLHSNLIALFSGFVISQLIYFFFIWSYTKKEVEEK